jgi:signal transduction histidine kinase
MSDAGRRPVRAHLLLRYPALIGMLAFVCGLGIYLYDNRIKDSAVEGSPLKAALGAIEVLVMGPGMAVCAYLIAENLRLREDWHRASLAQERERRFQLLGRIAASVAHEVRNPLHNLRLIEEELAIMSPPETQVLLDRVRANLSRLDQSVQLVYELARPTTLVDADLPTLDLGEQVQRAIAEVVRRRGHATIAHVPPDQPVLVSARESGLRIVLENLVRNAVEAAGKGEVIIGYGERADKGGGREGGFAVLTVRNPGSLPVGFTVSGTYPSMKPDGLGVGLSIANHLVAGFGGSLTITDTDGVVTGELALPKA